MTKKERRTEIICIVDRSGSMKSIEDDAIGGFNSFIDNQKKEPEDTRLSFILFNHSYRQVYNAHPIQQVEPLTAAIFKPCGTTALYDAIGRTIHDTEKRFKLMSEEDRPDLVIVAILTDGLENSSTDYNNKLVAKMISHQQEAHDWKFIFLAANQDAFATARRLAINPSGARFFRTTSRGTREVLSDLNGMVSEERKRQRLKDFVENLESE